MRFSVVTVCFNSETTIRDALVSVAAQDYEDFEHVVVDGSSRDGTVAAVRAMAHARLQWVSEPDRGVYDAMNKGLRLATGDYVIFLNSDDYFARADVLSLAARALSESGSDCLFGDTVFVREDGRALAGRIYSAKRFRPWWLRLGVMPPHPSMFVRRSVLLDLGGFDLSYGIAADFDLIARAILARACSWTVMPEVLTYFRVGGVSTRGLSSKLKLGQEMARSLGRLGQPLATVAVQGRFLMKSLQLRRRSRLGQLTVKPPVLSEGTSTDRWL